MQSKKIYSIRSVKADELVTLQAISRRTFEETFSKDNTDENMQLYLEYNLTLARLLEEFDDPATAFYFAEDETQLMGYLKVKRDNSQLEIERIYVLQEFHGEGIGQALLEKAFQLAQSSGIQHIWLGVWEHNPRAIRFYERNGFTAFGSHIFILGMDEQRDILMEKKLG